MSLPVILALDAGGTFFKSALVLPSGEIVPGSQHATPVDSQGTAEKILAGYAAVCRTAFDDAAKANLRINAVGISTPGPFDYANCTSRMEHKFPAIRGLNLREALDKTVPEIRGIPLKFLHDAHAFILGEQRQGAAAGHDNAVGVTLGTGIGFGCIIGGKIRDNGVGGPLVSIFKLPCRDGILEDYVSRRGIIRLFRDKLPPGENSETLDVIDIANLARDPRQTAVTDAARAAFRETGALLGETLRPILKDIAPTCLVAGGQISKSFDLFGDALREALSADGGTLSLVTAAKNPDTAALQGAAGAALS